MGADAYDTNWLVNVSLGPNVLWLAESLCEHMALEPGARVLDLGCGKGASSIFLAREYDVSVVAVDTLIDPTEIFRQVEKFGLTQKILPLRADARRLPFPKRYFDAVVSLNAFQYFGTDDMYLPDLAKFVRPGGRVGIVVPGLMQELVDCPSYFSPAWHAYFPLSHSAAWWQQHWERARFEVELADVIPGAWQPWADWYDLRVAHQVGPQGMNLSEAAMLRADEGRALALIRAIAKVT
jgi:cyclopropane fatty-acyl-phospholipid synthase-like methyltransferase